MNNLLFIPNDFYGRKKSHLWKEIISIGYFISFLCSFNFSLEFLFHFINNPVY